MLGLILLILSLQVQILSQLAPSQMAQLIVSTSSSNDTVLIDQVFNQLEQGNALKNVDQFFAQLSASGQVNRAFKCTK